jgi:uroporphyrin-III C-methyltransferase/precorrin-2 dehydrogenase/sirohydrochlorin ferrochelatase
VGAGPGSRDLITLRGARLLAEADVVFHDRLADPDLLDLAPPAALRVHVGKAPGSTDWPQSRINAAIVAAALGGQRVVRLKCGDPGIFGRGAEEAEACAVAGVPWESVPGVTAASVAAVEIGSFLTLRDQIDTVVLTTGHLRDEDDDVDWARYARPGTSVAIYMGVAKAAKLRDAFLAGGIPAEAEVSVVSRAGFPDCRCLSATVSSFPEAIRAGHFANPAIILLRIPKNPPAARSASGSGSGSLTRNCIASHR